VYATWAYAQIGRRHSDARPATTQRRTIDIYSRYDDAFIVERVLRECEATRGDFAMRIANKRMGADDLFNAIVKDATTSFASIARLCVRMSNETSRAFYNLIGDKFELFPMRLIDSTVDYDTWSLVAGNTTRTDCDGRALTADKRKKLNQVKAQKSATSNMIDDDDDDDDVDRDSRRERWSGSGVAPFAKTISSDGGHKYDGLSEGLRAAIGQEKTRKTHQTTS